MSPELSYFLTFIALSAVIGLPPWPRCQCRWGIVLGAMALGAASWLGWKIATGEWSWSTVVPANAALWQPLFDAIGPGLEQSPGQPAAAWRALPPFLQGVLLLLASYSAIRLPALGLSWIGMGLRILWFRWRPPVHPVCSGLLRPRLNDSHHFLRQVANHGLIGLGLFLAALPYELRFGDPLFPTALASPATGGATLPVPTAFFSSLVWVGVWILLLELRFSFAQFELRADWTGTTVTTRALSGLEALYRAYVDRHAPLLLFHRILRPTATGLPPAPVTELDDPEAAAQRLQWCLHGLPDAALDALWPPLRHHQHGGDLLFTETLSAQHLLLAALLIQQCRQAGETVLLIAPAAALEPLEQALRYAIARGHLLLNQRWAVLGRDAIAADTQIDVLGCAAEAVESLLLDQADLLAGPLARLRLVLCLETQRMDLSSLRLALSRLWLQVPRERVKLLVQADGWHDMESQLRYLTRFRDPLECRLNPPLSARRYLLIWDADSPHRETLRRSYFPQSQDPLETAPLLLLLPWQMGFLVAPRAAVERHNADTHEYLKSVLLPQQGQAALLRYAEAYQPLTYPIADPPIRVIQVEDVGNLPLALDYATPVIEGMEVLLNVVCGRYLLRDYYLDCLSGAGGEAGLARHLRPLATRPRGTLPQLVAALVAALKHGLRATQIQQAFLDLAPAGLLPPELARADWPSLTRLFERVLGAQAPRLQLRREQGETVFFIVPDYRFDPQPRLPVVDEQGQVIAHLPRSDHGLDYAAHQYRLIQGKFHLIKTVGVEVRVHHEDDPHSRLRRCYAFHRRYTLGEQQLPEGSGFVQHWPGAVSLQVSHWHGGFTGESLGYLEFAPDARPLASDPPGWSYTALQEGGSLRRERSWQNIACFELRHPALEDAEARARLAFTLCAVWQDALPSLFPGQAHRLAVVSPQAATLPEPDHDLDRFYRRLYPVWAGEAAGEEPILQIYLLEDADHDLGVVRALVQPEGARMTLALLRDYLVWAQEQPPERLYQTYGGETLPEFLDYAGVETLLDPLVGSSTQPATARLAQPKSVDPPLLTALGTTTALAPLSPAAGAGTLASAPQAETGFWSGVKLPACCGFCAGPLGSGAVTLKDDGRQRCHGCGQDAIDSLATFRRLWNDVVEGMERRYDIALPEAVQVRFVDAATVAQRAGRGFPPAPTWEIRPVGILVPVWCDAPTLWLENGAPRLSTMATLVKVLTHLWQASLGIQRKPCPLELLDGQALYAMIDYLAVHGGEPLAAYWRRWAESGDSPAALGYQRVAPHCPADPQSLFHPYFTGLLRGSERMS